MKKNLTALLCSLLLLAGITFTSPTKAYAALPETDMIQPCWQVIAIMRANLEEGLLGTYKASGYASTSFNYTVNVTCTMQYLNSTGWHDSDITWSDSRVGSCEAAKSWIRLDAGEYRVKVVASIYNGSTHLETATFYGNSKIVP